MQDSRETTLIKEFLDGNKKAFEELVNMYYPDVYRLCRYYIKDSNESYDLSQDVFILVYKNLNNFRGDAPFKIWLFRIVYNRCMEFLRRKPNTKIATEIHTKNDEPIDLLEENVTDTKNNPISLELKNVINNTLSQLPEKTRNVLELFYYSNFSCNEIAHILDMSEGAVKTALSRARNTLKEKLQPYYVK